MMDGHAAFVAGGGTNASARRRSHLKSRWRAPGYCLGANHLAEMLIARIARRQ
jgi:hypothetical protein